MTSTITLTRGHRPRRTVLTGLLAAAAVAGSLGATAPSAVGQATTATTDVVLRPNGDVSGFAVTADGASAASVLDDAVTRPRPVRPGDAIRADAAGESTVVTLGGRIRSTLRPTGARAWFFADTEGTTSLRVEAVSRDGVVLAGTTVAPGQRMQWRSFSFRPPDRAALKGIAMRFTAVGGGQAEVRAAYSSITSRSGPGAALRPRLDVTGFSVHPSGTASAALDDDVRSPAAPSFADRLSADAAGRSTTVRLADVDVSGGVDRVQAWYHARTGAGTRLRVEAVSGGQVRAASTLAASSPAGWRAVTVPVSGQSTIDDLQLRFTSVRGKAAEISAAHAVVTVRGASFADELNAYFSTLPPLVAGQEKPAAPTGPSVETVSEPLADIDAPSGVSRFRCTTTPVRAASNPEKIVTLDPDGGKMWLGALLQGQGYAGGPGSLADLPTTGKRAPIRIWTDLMGADVVRTVADPDAAAVHQGIAGMVRQAQDSGIPAAARISYQETSQSSIEDGLIKAGLSVKYMGGNAAADLTSQRKAQRSSLLVSLTQRAFTVNLVRPNRFSDYFDGRFTRADLAAMRAAGQIGPDNPPVVISNIAYGRVLYYSLSSTATQAELQAAVKASYEAGVVGGSGSVSSRQQAILDQAEVKVFAMGGPTAGVENLIRTHKIQDYFAAENTLARAVPISYQVDNLNGTAASFTETTDYNLRTCESIPNQAIDVGDVIRISKPQFYMDASRDHADMFGSLSVDGVEFWNRGYDNYQTIQNHTVTNPVSAADGNVRWPLEVPLDNDTNPTSRIQGSVNCRLWFPEFGTGSNQYSWTYDSRSSGPGSVTVPGGSRTCGTALRFEVTKVRDLWEYQP